MLTDLYWRQLSHIAYPCQKEKKPTKDILKHFLFHLCVDLLVLIHPKKMAKSEKKTGFTSFTSNYSYLQTSKLDELAILALFHVSTSEEKSLLFNDFEKLSRKQKLY